MFEHRPAGSRQMTSADPARTRIPFEATTFVEGGWWIILSPDTRRRARAATLAEVEDTARALIAQSVGLDQAVIDVHITVLRRADDDVLRARWTPPPRFRADRRAAARERHRV